MVKEIFDRSGETLEVSFLPWKRAKKEFMEGKHDLIYPLWKWEHENLKLQTAPQVIYHSPIVMLSDPTSKEPFCLVESYNYGAKASDFIPKGIVVNQTSHNDEQCLKQLESGRASGTLVDKFFITHRAKSTFNLKKFKMKNYDEGNLILAFQKRDEAKLSPLFQKNLTPFQDSNQREFELFIESQK